MRLPPLRVLRDDVPAIIIARHKKAVNLHSKTLAVNWPNHACWHLAHQPCAPPALWAALTGTAKHFMIDGNQG